ncbi:recombinase family protein [Rhizomicrobium electricum]|uniref:Recombinase family protein n=1 Tax=Rhizomicrobium electricum TaxID=480070 RepID=A0ABN1FBU9_9PROT|nr:recombinase family protein [Rhizomicrobium electricum]NIJ50743.1 DNA invertase Pin-like site-specific DNA recombinase [Rhizomicrobium electricum]
MPTRFVAYYRVSTAKQGASGLGLDAQRRAVEEYVKSAKGSLLGSFEEIESGKRNDRPALARALAHCRMTGAKLLIAKLDRLSRNVAFLANLMEGDVDFVACDMPTANNLTIHILAAVAQAEREAISARTKAALASIKERLDAGEEYISRRSGRPIGRLGGPNGLTVSRPDLGTAAVITRANEHAKRLEPTVRTLRNEGMSYAAIAARLTDLGAATPRGGAWTAMGVKRVLSRLETM